MYFHKGALFQEAEIYISLADVITQKNNNDIRKAHNETKNKLVYKKKSASCPMMKMPISCFTIEHMNGFILGKWRQQK